MRTLEIDRGKGTFLDLHGAVEHLTTLREDLKMVYSSPLY